MKVTLYSILYRHYGAGLSISAAGHMHYIYRVDRYGAHMFSMTHYFTHVTIK